MGNCMFCFPNRTDAATLSGGAWTAALPLNNLKNRIIGKVARSSTAALADTKFDIDLGAEKNIRVLSLTNHNFTIDAKYRIRGAAVSNFFTSVYDSGWLEVWPAVYPLETLDWEDDSWWTGKYTAEQISGYTTALIHILAANTMARYWRVEVEDTANAAGYVQAGRLFVGPAWQPTKSYGSSLGWETKTEVQEAIGGAEYFQRRTPFRVQRITLDSMNTGEAMTSAFEIQRRAGIDQEVLWIFDPSDTAHALRRRWLGRLRQLNQIEYPYFNNHKTAFEIRESL